ncbi:helix-turn-helix domain-containing protein, partial [Nocardia cyriacigeorgica]|uniref:helix-turn-helix domain-containing protein n=1 Tax=Nocardia cyriacigeorgica TaxID=135487 RepID=UPI0024586F00
MQSTKLSSARRIGLRVAVAGALAALGDIAPALALLEATARLVVERGYAALSLQAVADEAETSRPALYRRYADRAELVMA